MQTSFGLGLKRGEVRLCEHDPQWEAAAKQTIKLLHEILGDTAKDIQHVGSTAVKSIKAKPVIDLIVGVTDLETIMTFSEQLKENGFYFVGREGRERQPVFQCGEYDEARHEMAFLTHYIHIVRFDSRQWHNYINVRDYLNSHADEAKLYEKAKTESSQKNGDSLKDYHDGKEAFVSSLIEIANEWKQIY